MTAVRGVWSIAIYGSPELLGLEDNLEPGSWNLVCCQNNPESFKKIFRFLGVIHSDIISNVCEKLL